MWSLWNCSDIPYVKNICLIYNVLHKISNAVSAHKKLLKFPKKDSAIVQEDVELLCVI